MNGEEGPPDGFLEGIWPQATSFGAAEAPKAFRGLWTAPEADLAEEPCSVVGSEEDVGFEIGHEDSRQPP